MTNSIYLHLFQLGRKDCTIVANDWDFPVYAKVTNENCSAKAHIQKTLSGQTKSDATNSLGFLKEGSQMYDYSTNVTNTERIHSNNMMQFKTRPGQSVYVTILTPHSDHCVIAENRRYDPGNLMLITDDGNLKAFNGQNMKNILPKP